MADIMDTFQINGVNVDVNSTWKAVMDSFYGMCHTFDPSTVNKGMLQQEFIDQNNGRFSNAEVKFAINVRSLT